MAVTGVSSNSVPAAPPARQAEARQVIDKPAERPVEKTPAPKPAPSVNTSGQSVGTTINTSA